MFKLSPGGSFTKLYDFPRGFQPFGGLARGLDGSFYGTTQFGGDFGQGTIFRYAQDETFTTLHSFNGTTEGIGPLGDLSAGPDGNIYGITPIGPNNSGGCGFGGCGTIFRITPAGTFTTLHAFNASDGVTPEGGVIVGTDGSLYGTTVAGGIGLGVGTVFKLAPDGMFTILHDFEVSDGASPVGSLLITSNGSIYGVTRNREADLGTVFRIKPDGVFTSLHSFGGTDGGRPFVGLTQGTDGFLYGTTYDGGASNLGVVFRLAALAPPSVTTAPITLNAGAPAANLQIATVGDADQSAKTLVVRVNGASSATVNGVTVSGLSVNAAGAVTASVVASCAATNASFTLTVTDSQSATSSAQLNVSVTANSSPALGTYPATGPINIGASTTVTPSAAPSDNGSITSITAAAPGFTGTVTVNAAGVVSITNAGPAGTFTITVTATDNCGAQSSRSFSLTVVNNNCNVTVNPATLAKPYVSVPFLQALSATPAGGYTFSVSAGALPPGLNLVTALGITSIAGIPTTPGTFSFTIKAKRNNSTCEGARSFTVTIPATVAPILECVRRNANGSYTAFFGYDNQTGAVVMIPVGANNYFTPGNQNRGQTTVFQPGRVRNAFSVTFSANGGNLAIWFLKGPDGVLRPVNVTTTSIGCP